jgi:hypothetical protein
VGSLDLSLPDGTKPGKLGLMLDWRTAVEYDTITTALVGNDYSYSVASTVTERICSYRQSIVAELGEVNNI